MESEKQKVIIVGSENTDISVSVSQLLDSCEVILIDKNSDLSMIDCVDDKIKKDFKTIEKIMQEAQTLHLINPNIEPYSCSIQNDIKSTNFSRKRRNKYGYIK